MMVRETLRNAMVIVMLREIRNAGGALVLSGRNKTKLSNMGVTRSDLRWIIPRIVSSGQVKIEARAEGVVLVGTEPYIPPEDPSAESQFR
jgi:hypothetical protein